MSFDSTPRRFFLAKKKDSGKGPGAPVKPASAKKVAPVKKTEESKLTDMLAPSEADYLKSREDIAENEDSLDIVSFYLNGNLFAVEVEHVGAVIRSREVVKLPHTPDFIDGLISVRGEMILVMNLKKRLGIELGVEKVGNIIVTESLSFVDETGMIVDRMAGVMEVAGFLEETAKEETVNEAKGTKGASVAKEQGFIKGTVRSLAGQSIKVLDMAKLMAFDIPSGAA